MNETNLIPTDSQQLIVETLSFCKSIAEITINNAQEYVNASEFTKKVQDYLKKLDNDRKKLVKPYNDTVKDVNNAYKEPLDALKNIRIKLRDATKGYDKKIEDEAKEKQRIADEAAEKERQRLLKESEKEGQEDLKEVAETIKTPVVKVEEVPKIEGRHFKRYWTVEIVNKAAFVAWCLESQELQYIEIDTRALDKIAQATEGKVEFPGIKINLRREPIYR
jgi:transcriptional regulator of heat shock response